MNKRILFGIGGILVCTVLFLLNLFWGTVAFTPAEVMQTLVNPHHADPTIRFILLESRLPQALTAVLCGAALSASGLLLQTAFANPLADSSILGVNSGASLGVAIAMLWLGGSLTTTNFSLTGTLLILFLAFVGSLLIIALLLFFSSFLHSSLMLLIVGIMINYIISSVISLLNYSASAEGVHSYIVWGMGNFSGVSSSQLPLFCLVMGIGFLATLMLVKPLNALLLGENYATNLGFSIRKVRTGLLLTTGILTATTTAFCGPISFIGLAVPHIARMLLSTSDHRLLLPVTLLCGAVTAMACNLLCSLPGNGSLIPLNVITPIFGVPVILYVILFRRDGRSML